MGKVVQALNGRWDDRLQVYICCVGISAALYIPAFRRAASRSVGAMRDCNEYRPGGQSAAPAVSGHVASRHSDELRNLPEWTAAHTTLTGGTERSQIETVLRSAIALTSQTLYLGGSPDRPSR